MAKTQDKTRQVGGSTVCRVKFELIDKESGKVEDTEILETPIMLLVARDSKSKTGYCVRGALKLQQGRGATLYQGLHGSRRQYSRDNVRARREENRGGNEKAKRGRALSRICGFWR